MLLDEYFCLDHTQDSSHFTSDWDICVIESRSSGAVSVHDFFTACMHIKPVEVEDGKVQVTSLLGHHKEKLVMCFALL